jgi:hypothetical protein
MTDAGQTPDPANQDLSTLEPLEPLDAAAPASAEDPLAAQRGGLAAPAYSMFCRDKTFYRFLFAGVLLLVGSMLPYNADSSRALYQTMSGAFYVLLGIAMVWTWWGAISNNRSTNASIKWLLFCMAPLIASLWNLASFDVETALQAAKARGWVHAEYVCSGGWKELFGDMFGGLFKRNVERLELAENFWRLLGPAHFFVALGALMAEVSFFGGVIGGAKQNKAEQKQKMMAAAERRRR